MSFLQRIGDDSPFAVTFNTSTWNSSDSPDSTNVNWMTSSGNGFSFTGSGYLNGFLVPDGSSIGAIGLESNTVPRYQRGIVIDAVSSATRVMSDDMCIGYGSSTQFFEIANHFSSWPDYLSDSRFSVVLIEAS